MNIKPEQLSSYFDRLIRRDSRLLEIDRSIGFHDLRPKTPSWFRPASFRPDRVREYHDALSAMSSFDSRQGYPPCFLYLWQSLPDATSPLAVRMASVPNPLEDELPKEHHHHEASALLVEAWREASFLRDSLITRMVEDLRSGDLRASAFLIGINPSQREAINSAWWDDPSMVVDLGSNEMSPDKNADPRLPTFRSIQLIEVARTRAHSPAPTKAFDLKEATYMVAGWKSGGFAPNRPSREELQTRLALHFHEVPRDDCGSILKQLWGEGKRGPKPRK